MRDFTMPGDTHPAPLRGLDGQATINGKTVQVHWSPAAARALAARSEPLFVELELYFSCLVKKFVHFRAPTTPRPVSWVNDRLAIFFRPVTSTSCSWETAAELGRQPETDIDTAAVRRIAPKRVEIDYRNGTWFADYFL
jgi:hypothetical protein